LKLGNAGLEGILDLGNSRTETGGESLKCNELHYITVFWQLLEDQFKRIYRKRISASM